MAATINGDGLITLDGTSTTQGRVRLAEDTDNGTNYVELQAPANVASNVTFTLPGADGTSGQVLQTNGSGTLSFATPSAGAMTLVSSATASSSSIIAFTGLTNSYRAYMLEYDSVYLSASGDFLYMQISTDNGSTYLSSGYTRSLVRVSSSTVAASYATTGAQFLIGATLGFANVATNTGSGTIYFFAPNTSGSNPSFIQSTVTREAGGVNEYVAGSMLNTTTTAVNAFKLYSSSGTITAGNFRLYGIANA